MICGKGTALTVKDPVWIWGEHGYTALGACLPPALKHGGLALFPHSRVANGWGPGSSGLFPELLSVSPCACMGGQDVWSTRYFQGGEGTLPSPPAQLNH